MDARRWKKNVNSIFWAVVFNSLIGMVLSTVTLVTLVAAVAGVASPWYMIVLPLLSALCEIIILVGFTDLARMFVGNTSRALKQVRTGIILEIIADIFLLIPIVGSIVANVLGIIWAFIYIKAFGTLRDDREFPARDAANFIRIAFILALVSYALCIIPLVGVVGNILSVIVDILIIVGWIKFKTASVSSASSYSYRESTSSYSSSRVDDF